MKVSWETNTLFLTTCFHTAHTSSAIGSWFVLGVTHETIKTIKKKHKCNKVNFDFNANRKHTSIEQE